MQSSAKKRYVDPSHAVFARSQRRMVRVARRSYPTYRSGRYIAPISQRAGVPTGELKFHDVDLDDALIASGGTVTPTINIIPQGVTEVQRIGRRCTIKRIGWRYTLSIAEQDAQSTPVSADSIRMILFVDKQANGATATITDVLESANFQAFNNLANKGRFRVLMDRTHTIQPVTLASDGAGVVSSAAVRQDYEFFKECDLPIEFNAATGAITEIRSNNLGVLVISTAGVTNLDSKFRLRFTD